MGSKQGLRGRRHGQRGKGRPDHEKPQVVIRLWLLILGEMKSHLSGFRRSHMI